MITGTKSVIIQANVTTDLSIDCESDVLDNEEKALWKFEGKTERAKRYINI